MLLAKDVWERTAWHMAAEKGKLGVLDILLKWAKELQTLEDINNKFLLAKDDSERTAWHMVQRQATQNYDSNYRNGLQRI